MSNIGTTGEASESEMIFRERIEARTNVTDPSKDGTLKVTLHQEETLIRMVATEDCAAPGAEKGTIKF